MAEVFTMEQQTSRTMKQERLFAWLCGCIGVMAVVLWVVGMCGMLSHATARQSAEMGIRMAVGASRGDVVRQVTWEELRLVIDG
ncbi:MAG: hypothetical protein ACK5AZ_13490 [Bryobacteraceae bacterium]